MLRSLNTKPSVGYKYNGFTSIISVGTEGLMIPGAHGFKVIGLRVLVSGAM